jgi:hypothetical protein
VRKWPDKKLLDLLETVAWGERHFGSLVTNRSVRLRDMRRAELAGFVYSAGMVELVDDDGEIIVPERYREGWKLTSHGLGEIERIERRASGAAA